MYESSSSLGPLELSFTAVNICGDRHDSGVDLSDPPNSSMASSCRSSPLANDDDKLERSTDLKVVDLDFTFDDDEDHIVMVSPEVSTEPRRQTKFSQNYLRQATDDLGLKITSVKKVWDVDHETGSDKQLPTSMSVQREVYEPLLKCAPRTPDWKFDGQTDGSRLYSHDDLGLSMRNIHGGNTHESYRPVNDISSYIDTILCKDAVKPGESMNSHVLIPSSHSLGYLGLDDLYMSQSNKRATQRDINRTMDCVPWNIQRLRSDGGMIGFMAPHDFVLSPKFGPLIVADPDGGHVAGVSGLGKDDDVIRGSSQVSSGSGIIGQRRFSAIATSSATDRSSVQVIETVTSSQSNQNPNDVLDVKNACETKPDLKTLLCGLPVERDEIVIEDDKPSSNDEPSSDALDAD